MLLNSVGYTSKSKKKKIKKKLKLVLIMINFPLNINHGVALFSIALTLWGRHEKVLFLFRFILWLQPKFFPNVPVFWHQFSRLWSQPEY